MTKEHQRGDDRNAESVAIHDKQEKAAKGAKASSEAADTTETVAIAKHESSDKGKNGAALAYLSAKWNPSAWFAPLQSSWSGVVQKAKTRPRPVRVDVISRADDIVVRADVPGLGKDRLDLAVTPDSLTIRGQASAAEAGDYLKRERLSGEFARHLSLPFEVQADKASATIRNGLLEIVLPKSTKDRAQKIAIQG